MLPSISDNKSEENTYTKVKDPNTPNHIHTKPPTSITKMQPATAMQSITITFNEPGYSFITPTLARTLPCFNQPSSV